MGLTSTLRFYGTAMVVTANLIVIGLGVWWSAFVLLGFAAAIVAFGLVTFIIKTGFFNALLYVLVMAAAGTQVILFESPNSDVLISEVTFGNVFLDWTLGWAIDFIKGLPRGVAIFSLATGVILAGLSVLDLLCGWLSSATDFSIGSSGRSGLPLIVIKPALFKSLEMERDSEEL